MAAISIRVTFAKRCKNGRVRLLLTAKRVFPENCNRFIVDGAVRQTQGYPAGFTHNVKIRKTFFQGLADCSRYEPMDVNARRHSLGSTMRRELVSRRLSENLSIQSLSREYIARNELVARQSGPLLPRSINLP